MLNDIIRFTIATGAVTVLAQYCSLRNKKVDKVATAELSDNLDSITGSDGMILAKEIQLKEKFNYEGTCIIGPTGSGKTTSFFLPNLLSNNIKGSIVVTDPKGELFKLTSKYQKSIGRRVLKYSPLEPEMSEKYNLLEQCKDTTEVLQLAQTLLFNGNLALELATGAKSGGIEWVQMAEPLFASLLLYVKDLEYPYNTIEFALQLLITFQTGSLDVLFADCTNEDAKTQFNIFKTVGGADRTEGSIKITAASNLKIFTDHKINSVCSETTFKMEDLRKEPTILYITYPERKANYISPLMAPVFSQLLDKVLEVEGQPLTLLFDEFANVGYINSFSTHVSTVRSRKISVNICLQSLTQLYQIYGNHNAKAILNNLKTKIVLPGLHDNDTLSYLSNICGDTEIQVCSSSEQEKKVYAKSKKKLFENSELRCLKDKNILIIPHNLQPYLASLNCYWENNQYTSNIYNNPISVTRKDVKKINYAEELKKIKAEIKVKLLETIEVEEDAREGLFT